VLQTNVFFIILSKSFNKGKKSSTLNLKKWTYEINGDPFIFN